MKLRFLLQATEMTMVLWSGNKEISQTQFLWTNVVYLLNERHKVATFYVLISENLCVGGCKRWKWARVVILIENFISACFYSNFIVCQILKVFKSINLYNYKQYDCKQEEEKLSLKHDSCVMAHFVLFSDCIHINTHTEKSFSSESVE